MGYCIQQKDSCFQIRKENFDACLKAIKSLAIQTHLMHGGGSNGQKWFSWVNTNEFLNAKTLEEALKAWRWKAFILTEKFHKDPSHIGDLTHMEFTGEKLGDDMVLFNAIAPFVEPGSYLEIEGEDGNLWRWTFDGKQCLEIEADIDWEGYGDMIRAILNQKEILPTLIGIHPGLDRKIEERLR